MSNTKVLLISIFIILLVVYGFYEKNRKEQLFIDFKKNKKLICGDEIVQKSRGWVIRNNKFVTNGKVMKTMVFCQSTD